MRWNYLITIVLTLLVLSGCARPAPTPTPTPTPQPSKGQIILDLEVVPEKIITRKIIDNFLIGVGTTDREGWTSSTVLRDLRINGINYFLPFTSWASIERSEGSYTCNPCPGEDFISWLKKSGAVLNGHCLIFLMDEEWLIPRFAIGRPFDEQKEMIEKFVRAPLVVFQKSKFGL